VVTRLLVRNEVVWQNQRRPPIPKPLDLAELVVPPDESEPLNIRAGHIYYDPDEDLSYRIVGNGVLRPEDGWATANFWLKRLNISMTTLVQMTRRGLFDGAMEVGFPTRRYRVRSEDKALSWIADGKRLKKAR